MLGVIVEKPRGTNVWAKGNKRYDVAGVREL
jgi:hypothetical protein